MKKPDWVIDKERAKRAAAAETVWLFGIHAVRDALLGIGESSDGAVRAVQLAVESPLVDKSLEGARGIILNISGDETLSLYEVNEATKYIYEHTNPDVNIILGTVIDEELGDRVRATIIATDFVDGMVIKAPRPQEPAAKVSEFSLDTPDFMNARGAEIPRFKFSGSMEMPSFHCKDEDKK